MNSNSMSKHSILGKIPQGDLHVKILDLMAKRVAPSKEELFFDKGACKTCISHPDASQNQREERSDKSKEISVTKRGQQKKKQGNNMHNGTIRAILIKSQLNSSNPQRETNSQISAPTSVLLLQSKVVSVRIEGSKLLDVTIDLRPQLQLQKSEIKERLIQQLKLDLAEQQEKIKTLEGELMNSREYIKELNIDIENIRELARSRPYSDDHLINNEALSSVSLGPPSLKHIIRVGEERDERVFRSSKAQPKEDSLLPSSFPSDMKEAYLRIIKAQASMIEQHHFSSSFD